MGDGGDLSAPTDKDRGRGCCLTSSRFPSPEQKSRHFPSRLGPMGPARPEAPERTTAAMESGKFPWDGAPGCIRQPDG